MFQSIPKFILEVDMVIRGFGYMKSQTNQMTV